MLSISSTVHPCNNAGSGCCKTGFIQQHPALCWTVLSASAASHGVSIPGPPCAKPWPTLLLQLQQQPSCTTGSSKRPLPVGQAAPSLLQQVQKRQTEVPVQCQWEPRRLRGTVLLGSRQWVVASRWYLSTLTYLGTQETAAAGLWKCWHRMCQPRRKRDGQVYPEICICALICRVGCSSYMQLKLVCVGSNAGSNFQCSASVVCCGSRWLCCDDSSCASLC
jgi:hypothetical protein